MDNIKNFLVLWDHETIQRPNTSVQTQIIQQRLQESLYPGRYSRAARGRSLEVKNTDFVSADDATKAIRQGNGQHAPGQSHSGEIPNEPTEDKS